MITAYNACFVQGLRHYWPCVVVDGKRRNGIWHDLRNGIILRNLVYEE